MKQYRRPAVSQILYREVLLRPAYGSSECEDTVLAFFALPKDEIEIPAVKAEEDQEDARDGE